MIVPMSKIYIVTQGYNHARLLDELAQLGVVHVEPVDPEKAVAQEQTVIAISTLDQAVQILRPIQPSSEILGNALSLLHGAHQVSEGQG